MWRHETSRSGWPALATPVVVSGGMLALAAVMKADSASHDSLMRVLVAWVEVGLPLAAGVGATSLVGRDPAVELQLALPTRYRATVLRRFAVTLGWPVLLALAGTVVLLATGWWPAARTGAESLLVWAAPLCVLAALGVFLAVWLRSAAAASGLIGGIWLVEIVFAGLFTSPTVLRVLYLFPTTRLPDMADWATNRAVLLATAAALLAATFGLLSRPHRLLTDKESA